MRHENVRTIDAACKGRSRNRQGRRDDRSSTRPALTLVGSSRACTWALSEILQDLTVAEIRRRIHVAFHAVQGVAVGQLVFPVDDLDLDDIVAIVEPMVLTVLLAPEPAAAHRPSR